jgi:ABC-type sugar transport system ATPase subunit
MVYVAHDQVEAMTMGHRVAVLKPTDDVGVQLIGTVHLFGADGLRLASGPATLR